jgi:hypothetical protein
MKTETKTAEIEKKLQVKIKYQEAWVGTFHLNVEFMHEGIEYQASGIYYNGDRIVDVSINPIDDPCNEINEPSLMHIAQRLLEELDIDKFITY